MKLWGKIKMQIPPDQVNFSYINQYETCSFTQGTQQQILHHSETKSAPNRKILDLSSLNTFLSPSSQTGTSQVTVKNFCLGFSQYCSVGFH